MKPSRSPRLAVLAAATGLALTLQSPSSAQSPSAADALAYPLTATAHPPIPQDPFELWLAPRDPVPRSAPAVVNLSAGVRLHAAARYQEALPLVSAPLKGSPLGDYALYYTGLTELRLSQLDRAQATFTRLLGRPLDGYLAQGAALAAAEVAEQRGDHTHAVEIYRGLAAGRPLNAGDVLNRLARALDASGSRPEAGDTWRQVYYEHPLGPEAITAKQELDLRALWPPLAAGSARYAQELARAERLFAARRYRDARDAFVSLRAVAASGDRELIAVRIGAAEFHLKRYAAARTALEPYLQRGTRRAEARFFALSATRELGRHAEYIRQTRDLVAAFPKESWSEDALNNLASHFIRASDTDSAEHVFLEMLERFPQGRHAPRAAWRAGWWAYKRGEFDTTVRLFEQGAARFPRSDYRPTWLYWSARAHDRAGRRDLAIQRYALVVTDYAHSYYGRLASGRLAGLRAAVPPVPVRAVATSSSELPALPPNERVIRALIAHELYEDALRELQYAQHAWGDSPAIQATLGLVYSRLGELRRGINAMKRAYPQYMAAGGEQLPDDLLKVLFPVAYWDLIRKHAAARGVDPYLMAALIAQESTFDPVIRSSANAVGLMQVLPSTGRRYAPQAGIKGFTPSMLTNPEINVRLGTLIFADVSKRFGGVHLALASYNAGPAAVSRWLAERGGVDQDEFIDDIPYPETQNYVKKVLGTADDYRRLYGGTTPRPASPRG